MHSVVIDRRNDPAADTGCFEQIFKQIIPKTPAYMGLNLSLKGQRIVPKITQKREVKCERSETKSLHSIYTLARLASSSNRVRRSVGSSTGPTIMDFMQCINFKSRLDREREMIRRKIKSSTLYRKPSFAKSSSGFNIYNGNEEFGKVSCLSKNVKVNDDIIKSLKSPLNLLADEELENGSYGEDKKILCIGNKYLDLTSNHGTSPLTKTVSTPSINEMIQIELSDDNNHITSDFTRAISHSHLSPSSPSVTSSLNKLILNKTENEKETKVVDMMIDNVSPIKHADSKLSSSDVIEQQNCICPPLISDGSIKNKDNHNSKNTKRSTNYMYSIGMTVGKYSDAQKTEITLDDLSNRMIKTKELKSQNNSNIATPTSSKIKKSSGISLRKKSIKEKCRLAMAIECSH
ncbi:CLUMA_CG011913, isoform A [Clunio marinus]|uniref:CLUMA_CG011913, isoform A n=1 Tax=Clunio marinus TaxID=568069 RepID=A0A1J1IHQ0_9DIPT|nr:CLUMA_CG011913, isoform A [Clunio marinus]